MNVNLNRAAAVLLLLVAGSLLVAQTRPAATSASSYSDAIYHFALTPPNLGETKTTAVPAIFAGPAADGFAPNVNVTIQNVKTTRKVFMDQTLASFKSLNASLVSQKELQVSGHEAQIIEYTATINGHSLHFLAMFVITSDRVYLVTCTALPDQYKDREAAFQKCISSFKLTD